MPRTYLKSFFLLFSVSFRNFCLGKHSGPEDRSDQPQTMCSSVFLAQTLRSEC